MKTKLLISFNCLFFLVFSNACVKDLLPDDVSNEIMVRCTLVNYTDISISKDIYVKATITNGAVERSYNFIGNCWNFNTDTLPTLLAFSKKVSSLEASRSIVVYSSRLIYQTDPITTNIPVAITDKKIIVRSFIIFNDTIVRYSEPLILQNPYDYAN